MALPIVLNLDPRVRVVTSINDGGGLFPIGEPAFDDSNEAACRAAVVGEHPGPIEGKRGRLSWRGFITPAEGSAVMIVTVRDPGLALLSQAELRLARVYLKCGSRSERARELGVSKSQIDNLTQSMMTKLGIRHAAALAGWLGRNGF